MKQNVLIIGIFCLLILAGCDSSKGDLTVFNDSYRVIQKVETNQGVLAIDGQLIAAGKSATFQLDPGYYTVKASNPDRIWTFSSVLIKRGYETIVTIKKDDYTSPPTASTPADLPAIQYRPLGLPMAIVRYFTS